MRVQCLWLFWKIDVFPLKLIQCIDTRFSFCGCIAQYVEYNIQKISTLVGVRMPNAHFWTLMLMAMDAYKNNCAAGVSAFSQINRKLHSLSLTVFFSCSVYRFMTKIRNGAQKTKRKKIIIIITNVASSMINKSSKKNWKVFVRHTINYIVHHIKVLP